MVDERAVVADIARNLAGDVAIFVEPLGLSGDVVLEVDDGQIRVRDAAGQSVDLAAGDEWADILAQEAGVLLIEFDTASATLAAERQIGVVAVVKTFRNS